MFYQEKYVTLYISKAMVIASCYSIARRSTEGIQRFLWIATITMLVSAKGLVNPMTATAPTPQSIVGRLSQAQIVINTVLEHPAMGELLNQYGYTAEQLQAGKELYHTALELHTTQRRRYTGKSEAKIAVAHAWKQAQNSYKPLLKLARVLFKGNPALHHALALSGQRHASLTGWCYQARLFYRNALETPGVMERLALFNITQVILEAGLAEIDALEALQRRAESEKSNATFATTNRNEAMAQLERWIDELRAVARIALVSQPALLERFKASESRR
jgi:hypothetical protein